MQDKEGHMKKIFLLLICLLTIGSVVFSNSLIVYASDDESNITIASTDQFFSYSFAGMTYTSNISLDDAWNKAMKSQYELGNLGLDDIGIEYGLYNSSAINHIVSNENLRSSSRNPEEDGIKVHLEWQPTSNGDYIPLKYMKVQLYYIYYNNDSPLTSIILEEGYTDDNGDYVFTDALSWKELLHPVSGIIDMFNGIELRVRICPESKTFKIQKDWLNILDLAGEVLTDWSIADGIIEEFLSYSVITNSINVGFFDRNGDFGTIQIPYGIELDDPGGLAESNILNRSFKVAQSLAMGQKFINEQGINITNKVNVAYPAFYGSNMDTNAFCYYDYDLQSGLMCIGGLRDEWETMLHEYGHFVHASLNLFPFSWADYAAYAISSIFGVDGGVNPEHLGYEDHISDPNYGKGKNVGTKFAWSEGWAEAFSYIVQDYYWNDYYLSGTNLNTVGLEGVHPLNTTIFKYKTNCCEGQEDAITLFLNNLYNLQIDGLEMFLSSIKPGYINGEKIQTISKFVDNLLANYPTYHEEVGEILSNCHISSKLNPISSFDTYNPPVISWQINGSQYTPLNQFEIKFYDVNGNEKYNINNVISTKAYNDIFQYEISNSEWNNILTILGDSSEFGIEIYCYNTTGMLTGPYPSNRVICDTPYFFDFMLDETTNTYTINGITNVQSDDSVIIPNYYNNKKITKINDSAFLNCTQLSAIELPLYLEEIGSSVFKECLSLSSITISSSVQYIDDSAFENCSSLTSVIVVRAVTGITNLGSNAFDGCSTSLQIVVPQDRIAEYKNKVYWSSYKSKIVPNTTSYSEIDLNCLIDEEESVTLNAVYNKLYKLVADCTRSYKFVTDVSSKIIVYNSDMTMAYSGDNSLTAYLNKGTYYLSIEHSTITTSGTININYKLAYPTDGTAISYNSTNGTNISSSLHLTENDMCHARLKYTNNQGAGIYKFTLYAGANVIYPEYAIQVYTDADRNNLLSMYSVNELNILAQSNENENIIYVNLPENGTYYIDVTLPSNNYSILTFNVESIEANNINYLNSLSVIGFNVIFENSNAQSYFEEVTISHRSEIQLDILTSGIINNNIKVYVFEKVRDPGYEPGINYYYIETVHINEITSSNSSPVYTIVLNPGTYYFGYAENEDNVNINYALRRMVDYTMNMEDTLVADPYYEGYELGSEVNLNNGLCDNYNITEGFTRNIYLMVEDRLTDPMSRLDYDWYSSNESVAKVTNYGTVLGMPVDEDTTVTIYAVLKADPSIVYYKVFTILNDEEEDLIEIELEMSYSYSEENGEYQLELNSANCPYPMIQYYDWIIYNESNEEVLLNYWGNVTSTGPCEVLIVGTYNLNNRVRIFITLTIEE